MKTDLGATPTQRVIKFRAWDKEAKRIIPWSNTVGNSFRLENTGYNWELIYNHPERYDLMQFTGLTDKNGKEIWEGDVVPCIYRRDGHADHVYEVIWYEPESAFRLRRHGNACVQMGVTQTMRDATRNEVIGNVWEHPELLKQ